MVETRLSNNDPRHDPRQVREQLMLRFVQQAPYLPSAADLGTTSCPVTPWPHQLEVVRQVTTRFPESFLFADEVGLGKTIEAGLALRQLVISGRVRRALLLVPKSILRQWQEELYEKLVLDIPRYENGRWIDVRGHDVESPSNSDNPWNQWPIVLASSQLAKQRQRRRELLSAEPWDLVLVDEAHHARRRSSGKGAPNQLLQLLAGHGDAPGLKDRCRCLYLLSATPMQVHAVELWDLLVLLGMGGRWGADESEFLRYFEELRRPFEDRDWPWLVAMSREAMADLGGVDPVFRAWARERLGEDAEPVEHFLRSAASKPSETVHSAWIETTLRQLSPAAQQVLDRGLRRHTPLRALAWRHTRGLLRAYRRAGWIEAAVPRRSTLNVWIPLSASERDLYQRIEAFVSDFFQRYEARRRGLGFAMTLYRRRLTSSFYAVRRSLERRLKALRQGVVEAPEILEEGQDELLWEGDGWASGSLFGDEDDPPRFEDESVFIEDFLQRLESLPRDSKLDRLQRDLDDLLSTRDRILVFTQYIDTMDFLRGDLVSRPDCRVACYSGRGGEVYAQGRGWIPCTKDDLKERFRRGDLDILLCTEAAGEGLNLQTCGVLINFDMPWNPMRVEQRIGRIDRIGQTHDTIWIRNYFYQDTVEAEIYRRLSHRIDWFEEVVGTLQPILHDVGESIRQLAMLPAGRRERPMAETLHRLENQWSAADRHGAKVLDGGFEDEIEAFDLDARLTEDAVTPLAPRIGWQDIERVLTESSLFEGCWTALEGAPKVYELRWRGQRHRVTFDPDVFEGRPYAFQLLTYGQPLFVQLMAALDDSPETDHPGGIGLYRTSEPAPVSLFMAPDGDRVIPLESLQAMEAAWDQGPGKWSGADERAASAQFSRRRRDVLSRQNRVEQRRRRARRSVLVESGRHLLRQAVQIERARARRPGLFDEALDTDETVDPWTTLARRGPSFARLVDLCGGMDPFLEGGHDTDRRRWRRSSAQLEREWQGVESKVDTVLREIESLQQRIEAAETTVKEPSAGGLLQRLWFCGLPGISEARFAPDVFLPTDTLRPFVDGVPFFDDLPSLINHVRDVEGDPQRDEKERPGDYRWVALNGRRRPRAGLCVVPIALDAMARIIPPGSRCLLQLAPRGPWEGKVLLLEHPEIEDPELGGASTLRRYESRSRAYDDGSWQSPQLFLHAAPQGSEPAPRVLEDIEESSLWVIAELLEIL